MGNRTPDFSKVIKNAMQQFIADTHVSMPATVVSYDPVAQLATVQPLFKNTPQGAAVVNYPQIIDIPVRWARVGLAVIYMPMKPGDKVGLIFADRSLDNWQASDGVSPIDQQDLRAHDLTDAWVIPGMYPPTDPIPNYDPSDIRIILFDTSGNVRSEFYLGGDTGDIVALAENFIMLGDAAATEAAVLGNALTTLLNTIWKVQLDGHTHGGVTAGGAATSAAIYVGAGLTSMGATELSTKVKVK